MNRMRNPVVMVQARVESSRLPGKVLRELPTGRTVLETVLHRLEPVKARKVVVTADTRNARRIAAAAYRWHPDAMVLTGSEDDVLDRFYTAAVITGADPIVRITADCPLLDAKLVQRLLDLYAVSDCDYAFIPTGTPSNDWTHSVHGRPLRLFPDGLDAEVFSMAALRRAWSCALSPYEREHVTPYIWKNFSGHFKIDTAMFSSPDDDIGHLRWTLDTEDDWTWIRSVFERFAEPTLADVLLMEMERGNL